jgi:hypothetical protein
MIVDDEVMLTFTQNVFGCLLQLLVSYRHSASLFGQGNDIERMFSYFFLRISDDALVDVIQIQDEVGPRA